MKAIFVLKGWWRTF
ncbi:TPA: trp operon leader peptide [Escherichia coli]|nr:MULTISPECIES: trp operon leader peptide [Escherichia]EFN9765100.1 trp operon leader peptide [Escherichia coli]EKJ3335534.1 trp operon leader peptide [Escherichia coli]MCQ6865063.1 trp operon leader peptide [Escherichia coli]MCV0847719.1 trp operon leader peptide [Escherichia coli]MXE45056.1 trp operon leader peptide [Escherichia sp. HH41S]